MFRAPGGRPASTMIRPSARAESGVSDEGRSTTAHPAASAGPTPRAGTASGKFHGLMIRQGPTGDRTTRWRLRPSGDELVRPSIRTASSANHSR